MIIANEAKVKDEFAQLINSERAHLIEQGLGEHIECSIDGPVAADDLYHGFYFDDLEDFCFRLLDCGNGYWTIEVRDRDEGSVLSHRS